jgi:hypothetical protein
VSKRKELTSLTNFPWEGEDEAAEAELHGLRAFGSIYIDQSTLEEVGKQRLDALAKAVTDFQGGVDLLVLDSGAVGHLLETKAPGWLTSPEQAEGKSGSKGKGKKGGRGKGRATPRQDLESRFRANLRRHLQERTEASTGELAAQMLPDVPIPSPLKVLSAQREAEARLALLREFGAYSSEEIGELRSRAANRHALASRWRGEGRVFSVDYRGRQLFPGFQFDPSAAPLPVVAEVLAELPREEMSEWEVALWWVAANEWLGGERPVDVVAEDPGALPRAAARLAEPAAL